MKSFVNGPRWLFLAFCLVLVLGSAQARSPDAFEMVRRLGVNLKGLINENQVEQKLKTAFRRLAMKYHPDRNDSPDAGAIFQKLNEAYDELKNKGRWREVFRLRPRTANSQPAQAAQSPPSRATSGRLALEDASAARSGGGLSGAREEGKAQSLRLWERFWRDQGLEAKEAFQKTAAEWEAWDRQRIERIKSVSERQRVYWAQEEAERVRETRPNVTATRAYQAAKALPVQESSRLTVSGRLFLYDEILGLGPEATAQEVERALKDRDQIRRTLREVVRSNPGVFGRKVVDEELVDEFVKTSRGVLGDSNLRRIYHQRLNDFIGFQRPTYPTDPTRVAVKERPARAALPSERSAACVVDPDDFALRAMKIFEENVAKTRAK